MVQMFRAGDILGEMGVIDGGVRSADAMLQQVDKALAINSAGTGAAA